MSALADALGDLEYPIPVSDRWLRILFALLPCGALVVVSVFWQAGAPFLLAFAGAFASIQLVDPYKRASQAFVDFLTEAREQRRTAIEHLRIKLAFQRGASLYEGFRPVGYSRLGRQRARRRFRRVARQWQRSFWDLSGRVRDPVSGHVPAAAVPRWLYPRRKGFDYWSFVRGGASVPGRVVRSLVGSSPVLIDRLLGAYESSRGVQNRKKKRAERLLTRVGKELVRATVDREGDAPVRQLAVELDLDYREPVVHPGWVLSRRPSERG
jgi:hypothetical protein